jgi:hypothetical protein
MGLLVAGITNGASMIENAKITSLKREVDDYIRDVFTFYSRTGRFPGDLDGSGRMGWMNGLNGNVYPNNSFSAPYSGKVINTVSGPFVELYLYGISSFKPDPNNNGITYSTLSRDNFMDIIAPMGGIPTSKIYKNFVFTHRTEIAATDENNSAFFGLEPNTKAINTFMPNGIKLVNIIRKIDLKFDDDAYNSGNIRGYCNDGVISTSGKISYSSAANCIEAYFYLEIK